MEKLKLESLASKNICDKIIKRLGDTCPAKIGTNKKSKSTPRMATSRSMLEISEMVSKRRETYASASETEELYRKHLNLRPPEQLGLSSYRRERPLSEFTLKNDWKKRNWEVTPIPKPLVYAKSSSQVGFDVAESSQVRRKTQKKSQTKEHPGSDKGDPNNTKRSDITGREKLPPISTDVAKAGKICEEDSNLNSMTKQTTNLSYVSRNRSASEKGTFSWGTGLATASELSAPGWGSRTLDKRFLEQAARELLGLDDDEVVHRLWLLNAILDLLVYWCQNQFDQMGS